MTTYVVGDIQGCLQPLQCLLEAVAFDPEQDMLWSVGDIVNRGPQSLETLRFLHNMRDNLKMVLGNHDLHLLAVAAGARQPGRGDTLTPILEAPDREELLAWLLHQPLVYSEHGHTMVHAGIPPQWSVADALARAREVEQVLCSEQCVAFFSAMYGNEPAAWSDELHGMARLRLITNYLTRMRYCTPSGALDLKSKGPQPDNVDYGGEKVCAWFNHKRRKTADDKILFGHWASLQGRTSTPLAIGLDTGCVWGGALTFYALEDASLVSCDCRKGGRIS
ncbi:MAG: symmetrical bis(5'-nucleosyl)-tetraphosphatase [Halioglobus sp.]